MVIKERYSPSDTACLAQSSIFHLGALVVAMLFPALAECLHLSVELTESVSS